MLQKVISVIVGETAKLSYCIAAHTSPLLVLMMCLLADQAARGLFLQLNRHEIMICLCRCAARWLWLLWTDP